MSIKKTIPKKKAPAKKKATCRKPPVKPLTEQEKQAIEEEKQLLDQETKRADWELNNIQISKYFLKACLKGTKIPTYAEIARGCKLNERTVRRHFEQAKMLGDQTQKMQMLRDQSLLTIAVKSIKGEAVEWNRLFHQIVDGIGGLGGVSIKTNSTSTPAAAPTSAGKLEIETTLQIS